MTERLQIGGAEVEPVDIDGTRYFYPRERLDIEHIRLSLELSSAHTGDRIVALDADPERYPAQGAYFTAGRAESPDFVLSMANLVDERSGALLKRILSDERQVATLRKIGDHLAAGGNILNAVPHGPLLDIGLLHAIAYAGLGRLGYHVRTGIVISHGVTGLASEFNGDQVPLAQALGWACDKIWFVTPRTENTRNSRFSDAVSDDQIKRQNRAVRADIEQEQDAGGMLITAALSATSYRLDEDGVHWLQRPTGGTLAMFSHPKTLVAVVAGKILEAPQPEYAVADDLIRLRGDHATLLRQGDAISEQTAQAMNCIDPATVYAYARRRLGR